MCRDGDGGGGESLKDRWPMIFRIADFHRHFAFRFSPVCIKSNERFRLTIIAGVREHARMHITIRYAYIANIKFRDKN